MKIKGSKLGTIVASTGVVIFTLAATFSASIAWFAMNYSVRSTGMQVSIEKEESAVTEITVHDFYGSAAITENQAEVNYWGFNPTPSQTITFNNYSPSGSGFTLNMSEYSELQPHRPVLLLFKVQGDMATIKAISTSSYFDAPCPSTTSVETKEALNSYQNPVDGLQIAVTTDESENNKKTVYKYSDANSRFELIWKGDGIVSGSPNHLSSAIEARSFSFSYNPKTTNTKTAAFGGDGNKSAIALTEAQCTSINNASSFVDFSNMNPQFNSEISLFSESITNKQYVGIIFDYNSAALGYIYTYYMGTDIVNNALTFNCDWSLEI